ncbi:PREDICTED: uncharacterized protein LOC107353220 isoform X1 [Acropora digitifera]|uniref:uncharacterized protein LOC107353220 isoform X1 n=1 Tax=Acropora digitifera TaxID=70779 RepID=UPI00077B0DF2|nr:PREDICTED: uncharacterized protein LOC107353220 isoform X1 [Acropora digitifera]
METAHKSIKMGSISYSCGKKGIRTEQEYQESILAQQMANCALHISRREAISATSSITKVKHLQFKEESKKASTETNTHKVPFFKPCIFEETITSQQEDKDNQTCRDGSCIEGEEGDLGEDYSNDEMDELEWDEVNPSERSTEVAELIVPPGTNEAVEELKNQLLERARMKSSEASLTTIDFESAKKYQESRPSLKSLKTHLQYVKCCSLEWEREDHRVTKELLYATWIFAEKSQLLVVERQVHSKADRYRLLVPFRAFLGSRFNISTDTLAIHVQRLRDVQIQVVAADSAQGTWKCTQDSLLSSVERGILSLTIKFRPEKTNLVEMQEQFRQQPRLSKSLNVGIRPDMQYTLETEEFEELQDRRPIVIDPTLVRAAQLADIHLLNEAKERGNDLKFLVQMYFGLEEGFNKLLRSRVLSAKSSSAE